MIRYIIDGWAVQLGRAILYSQGIKQERVLLLASHHHPALKIISLRSFTMQGPVCANDGFSPT